MRPLLQLLISLLTLSFIPVNDIKNINGITYISHVRERNKRKVPSQYYIYVRENVPEYDLAGNWMN